MTKKQFIDELKNRLATLPVRERENALRYYTDFFEDADGESEENIAKDLGSPLEVADIILRDYYTTIKEQSDYSQKSRRTQGTSGAGANPGYRSPAFTPWYEQDAKREGNSVNKFFSDIGDFFSNLFNGSLKWLVWVLLFLTCPIWIPLVVAGVGAVFGVIVTIVALGFAGVIVLMVFFAVSATVLFTGISILGLSPLGGFITLSLGMLLLGICLLITVPALMLLGFIPKMFKAFFGAFKKKEPMNVPPPSYNQYANSPPAEQPSEEPAGQSKNKDIIDVTEANSKEDSAE